MEPLQHQGFPDSLWPQDENLALGHCLLRSGQLVFEAAIFKSTAVSRRGTKPQSGHVRKPSGIRMRSEQVNMADPDSELPNGGSNENTEVSDTPAAFLPEVSLVHMLVGIALRRFDL